MSCLFCDLVKNQDKIVYQNQHFYCVYDSYPVTPGHMLIISKCHLESFFDLNQEELNDFNDALLKAKSILDKYFSPSGYNVGFNEGVSAGQTIMHLHIHVIPRRDSDCDDPRGGVRGVIPEKQKY